MVAVTDKTIHSLCVRCIIKISLCHEDGHFELHTSVEKPVCQSYNYYYEVHLLLFTGSDTWAHDVCFKYV